MTMKKTAIIYARVSTKRQADEELPLQSQIERCEQKAENLHARVVRTFIDGGVSGRADDRPEFQAAIAFCERHGIDLFITWSTSRFARNVFDSAIYKRRLEKAGTRLAYVSCDIDQDTMSGFMMERVMEVFDEVQSRQISADTQRSMRMNAESGFWNGGRPPFGYEPRKDSDNPKRKRLYPLEQEAAIVREIFQLRVDGSGAKTIAQLLNDQGKTNRGKPWAKHSVAALLRNMGVIGCVVYGKRDNRTGRPRPRDQWIVVKSHEPIIDQAQWDIVQNMMDDLTTSPSGAPRSNWLFVGLMRCAECGASLQIETAKSGRYSYYNCRANQKHGGCRRHAIRADKLDPFIIDVICRRIFNTENLRQLIHDMHEFTGQWLTERDALVKKKVRTIDAMRRAEANIMDTIEELGSRAVDVGILVHRLQEHENNRLRVEREIDDIQAEAPPVLDITEDDTDELAEFLTGVIKENDNPKRTRGFFSSFIDHIDVGADEITISYKPEFLVSTRISTSDEGGRIVPSREIWLPKHAVLGTKTIREPLPARLRLAA